MSTEVRYLEVDGKFKCAKCSKVYDQKRFAGAHFAASHGLGAKKVMCDFPGCGMSMNKSALGTHKKSAHGVAGPASKEARGLPSSKPGRKKRKEPDLIDALISEFRRMLDVASNISDVVNKLKADREDMRHVITSQADEIWRLERRLADLGKHVDTKDQQIREIKQSHLYLPLESRLTQEEIAYLNAIKEGL